MSMFGIFNNLLVVCKGCNRTLKSNMISKVMFENLKEQISSRNDIIVVGSNIEKFSDNLCPDCLSKRRGNE